MSPECDFCPLKAGPLLMSWGEFSAWGCRSEERKRREDEQWLEAGHQISKLGWVELSTALKIEKDFWNVQACWFWAHLKGKRLSPQTPEGFLLIIRRKILRLDHQNQEIFEMLNHVIFFFMWETTFYKNSTSRKTLQLGKIEYCDDPNVWKKMKKRLFEYKIFSLQKIRFFYKPWIHSTKY